MIIDANDPNMAMCCANNSAITATINTAFAMLFVSKSYRPMGYLKIYSKTEIDTDSFIPHLRFDYKRTDSDGDYYPEPTYEYFYDDDSELEEPIEASNEEWEIAHDIFIDNLHWIYGRLDALKIDYKYNIESGEWRDESHQKYKEGYESALANFC